MTENQRLALLIETFKKEEIIRNRQQFIEKIDADKTYISRILNGKLTLTSKYCDKICSAYPQVNKDWLLYGKGDMFKSINNIAKDDNTIKDIRKIIKYIIFKEDCTQEEIADNLGVNKTYLSEIINGRYPVSKKLQDKIVLKYPYILSNINSEKISDEKSEKISTHNIESKDIKKYVKNDNSTSNLTETMNFYKQQIESLMTIIKQQQETINTLLSIENDNKKTKDTPVTAESVLYTH